jgi:GNAT superfamily N-acetyltransferase
MREVLIYCGAVVEEKQAVPRLMRYLKHEVPREIAAQIRSYVRVQWPHLDGRGGTIWDVRPSEAMTFVLMEDELLVSHAEVKRKDFEFEGEILKVLGVSAVFTYPAWRGSGYGKQIVAAASDSIRTGEADAGILFCGEGRRKLYESCGWKAMTSTVTLERDAVAPTTHGCLMMFLPVTECGQAMLKRFAGRSVFVGRTTW